VTLLSFRPTVVDRNLRVPEVPTIFAAGDTAHAVTDDLATDR